MKEFFDQNEYSSEDIVNLINAQAEESINLDFKSAGSLDHSEGKKNEISKDVSAFANSDGGIIIYGLHEQNHVANSVSFIDGKIYTKEWLEHVISSKIQRKIPDLRIYPIRFDDKVEQSVYIVKIPQSPFAPHLSSSSKFYKRYNFESVPMNEYEIRDTYNRIHQTKLIISDLLFDQQPGISNANKVEYVDYSLKFQLSNIGNSIEELYKLEIKLPIQIYSDYNGNNPIQNNYIRKEEKHLVFSINNKCPLFQNEITTIAEAGIRIKKRTFPTLSDIGVETKLYFSNGIENRNFNLSTLLIYNSHPISAIDWI